MTTDNLGNISGKNAVDFRQLYQTLINHILKSKAGSSETERQAAFDNSGLMEPLKTQIDKVANYAYRVTDADLQAVKNSGKTEDEIFELVICGAVGQASRQYKSALDALDAVKKSEIGGQHAP